MGNKTLVISKAKKLYPDIIQHLKDFGFRNVEITGLERDALYTKITEVDPELILIGSSFNQAATPFNVGEILKLNPDLNIAAVAVQDFPLGIASWFIWHGAKSCLHLWADGMKEFNAGLSQIKKGREYISPVVQSILDLFPEWPETKDRVTKRQFECMVLLCCGLSADDIAYEFGVCSRTIEYTIYATFDVFQIHSKEELISRAFTSGLVTREDLKFFRKKNDLKLPEWAIAKQKANEKLQEIYSSVYGGNYDYAN